MTTPLYSNAATLAGLFHDFGKANSMFQSKLKKGKGSEPYRHEWISCMIFFAFVDGRPDKEWLEDLSTPKSDIDKVVLPKLNPKNGLPFRDSTNAPLAQIVAWLIVSHHQLPKDNLSRSISLNDVDSWLDSGIDANWNSRNHHREAFSHGDFQKCISFPHGTPFSSHTWRDAAAKTAQQSMHNLAAFSSVQLSDAKLIHMARLSLMLGDHIYSSGGVNTQNQDEKYIVYANTSKETKQLRQRLDEHCIGVAQCTSDVATSLETLTASLPHLQDSAFFNPSKTKSEFKWQDTAHSKAKQILEPSRETGFFGINMASTGKGKTLANARIMAAISDKKLGVRFSVAVGLRSLTLQTGEALSELLGLSSKDVATIIGSNAVQELHQFNKNKNNPPQESHTGSDSTEALDTNDFVSYEGLLNDKFLSRWTKSKPEVNKLISAPVTVSTIDQLIPASEGVSNGRQIAPLLRLLSSDLILDEVDDFSLEDTPAISRLIFFAGLLGSKVLISSATLPPSLTTALFESYKAGRSHFKQESDTQVTCACFDEFNSTSATVKTLDSFKGFHTNFINLRKGHIDQAPFRCRIGKLVDIPKGAKEDTSSLVTDTIHRSIESLSKAHSTTCSDGEFMGKTVSMGIVRIANINPLTKIAEELFNRPSPKNTRIHYCVYHSQFPLILRSEIERALDATLRRTKSEPELLFRNKTISDALKAHPEMNHIFVVLASPIAEVGRDHDYDWAIVEPSSARSIIQVAGRIQRHRQKQQFEPNVFILSENIKAIRGNDIAYSRPGFESKAPFRLTKNGGKLCCLKLENKNLALDKNRKRLVELDPSIRFTEPDKKSMVSNGSASGFVELEHLAANLFVREYISPWIKGKVAHAFGEFQNQTPFRASAPTDEFILIPNMTDGSTDFYQYDKSSESLTATTLVKSGTPPTKKAGVSFWPELNPISSLLEISSNRNLTFSECCSSFSTLHLPSGFQGRWQYNQILGARNIENQF